MARPEEQDLVSMVVEAFRDGWPVARSFEELPETFKINGSTVRVYHRTGHVPLSADVDMLERFKARFETPPGIQTEWIPADAPFGARIAGEVGARVTVIGTHPTQRSSAPEATTLLHYDTIKAPMDLTVAALFVDSHCPGATAEVLAVPSSGGEGSVVAKEKLVPNKRRARFTLSVDVSEPSHLALRLISLDPKTDEIGYCGVNLRVRVKEQTR